MVFVLYSIGLCWNKHPASWCKSTCLSRLTWTHLVVNKRPSLSDWSKPAYLLKESIRSWKGCLGCLYAGGGIIVNFSTCFRITSSKRLMEKQVCTRQNWAPQNMSGVSFDQNIDLGSSWGVSKKKKIALNRRNSPDVRGSTVVFHLCFLGKWLFCSSNITPAAKSKETNQTQCALTDHHFPRKAGGHPRQLPPF